MSMEKITKEELLAKLGGKALSEEELEKVSGGSTDYWNCKVTCAQRYALLSSSFNACLDMCQSKFGGE